MSRGGPSKLTPEMEEQILECIEVGMPHARMCEMLGFTENALQKHKNKHPEFYARFSAAQKRAELFLLKQVNVGSKGWQGPAWLLSKRNPSHYGRKVDEAPPIILPVRIITEEVPDHPKKSKSEAHNQEAEAQ